MNWIGIERVIVTQGMAHQLDNANLVACLEQFGDIAWGIAAVDATTSEAELDRLAAARVRGARIMNLPGGAANLTKLEEVDAIAASRDWMIAIQFDGSDILDYEHRLSKLRSRWVLDHHGKFFCGVTPESPQVQATKRLIDGGAAGSNSPAHTSPRRQADPTSPTLRPLPVRSRRMRRTDRLGIQLAAQPCPRTKPITPMTPR